MKIRKLFASLLATTMLATMISGFTVAKAAEAPVLSAVTGYEDGCITVTVSYSGFENFVQYSGSRKTNVRGISALSFEVTTSDEDAAKITYDGAETLMSGSSAGNNVATFAFLATTKEAYVTKTEGDCAKFYFIADENETVTFNVTTPVIAVEESISGVASPTVSYQGDQVTCATVTYGEVEEPEKTLSATIDETIEEVVAPSGKTSYGISGVVAGGALFNKIVVNVKDVTNNLTGSVDFELGTAIEANNVTFGLNIWGAPADVDFEATAEASLVAAE